MPLDSLSQSFVDDGFRDFHKKILKTSNPHPKDTAPYYLWERGWMNAERIMRPILNSAKIWGFNQKV